MDNRPVKFLLGPWFVGTCIELLCQGVLSAQFVKYFAGFRADPLALKVGVGILAVFTYGKSIQAFTLSWYQLIIHFGDLAGALSLQDLSAAGGILGATITFVVQIYFCTRLYVVSKKWYIVVPTGVLVVFALVSNIVASSYAFQLRLNYPRRVVQWYHIYLPSIMAANIVLTAGITYFLVKKKDISPQSFGAVNALLRFAFQTAAAATIFAVVNLVIAHTFPVYFPGSRESAASSVQTVLPKIYAFSMMWTLNDRAIVRDKQHLAPTVDDAISRVDFSSAGDGTIVDVEHGLEPVMSQTSTVLHNTPAGKHARLSMASEVEEMVFAPPEPVVSKVQ
ncbi:hypothetical protein FB451DRAFT_1510787 [Mycena latifolia]|nr:hypothetical protein FB451DRAFT_1510787 [Mycena latifolia]